MRTHAHTLSDCNQSSIMRLGVSGRGVKDCCCCQFLLREQIVTRCSVRRTRIAAGWTDVVSEETEEYDLRREARSTEFTSVSDNLGWEGTNVTSRLECHTPVGPRQL